MPYRRLPNTDASRLRALKIAKEKGRELPPFKLAFSQGTLNRLLSFLPNFEAAMLESKQAYSVQVNKSKDYLLVMRKARIYISHFLQVFNMAIMRCDIPAAERGYFGLQESSHKLPPLNTESEILKWGEVIIQGETQRAMERKAPVTNPTMAVVKVWYEKFVETYKYQKTLQKNAQRSQDKIDSLREQANTIITDIWDEVEKYYDNDSANVRRAKSSQYGIVYVFRKNEIKS